MANQYIYKGTFISSNPPFRTDVIATDDPNVAFKDIDVAILVGAMPRREGMERKDLLKANAKIFETQGKALDQHAKKTVKVRLQLTNPAGFSCMMLSRYPVAGADCGEPCQHQCPPLLQVCSLHSHCQLLLFDQTRPEQGQGSGMLPTALPSSKEFGLSSSSLIN